MPPSPPPDPAAAEFLRRDTFAREMGIELTEVRDGFAVARLALSDRHLNGLGLAHGGAVFTLADLAFAAAANAGNAVAVAINANISFVHPGKPGGTLVAIARETSRSGRLATYAVEIRNETGQTAATFQGLAYRKPDRSPESDGSPKADAPENRP
jgi:acyl-CoA thioesterase